MKKVKIFVGALLVCALVFGVRVSYVFAENAEFRANSNTICEGVFIDDINIGGMTKEQAKKEIETKGTQIGKTTVTVSANSKKSQITMKELGYTINADECIEKASNLGNNGNLIQRYKEISDAKNGKMIYESTYTYDDSLIEKFVNETCKKDCNCEPVDATMDMSSGKPSVKKGQDGQVIDTKDTIEKIKQALGKWDKKEVSIEAKVEVEKPKVTEESLKDCTEILGECTVQISSNPGSQKNIKRGMELINASIVPAGETFSILSKISPCSYQNGYTEGAAYVNGKASTAIGGGICQVSTTLYNAVLEAELDVVARKCHSKPITYMTPGLDAMIDENSSDFKFKNNLSKPVYVQAVVSGTDVTVRIFGKETRDSNRKVEYKSDVQTTGNTRTAQTYKYVYVNGVLQSKEPVAFPNSSYRLE